MTLGERIQSKRNALGLSQEKLAEVVGVSRQAVSKWELGDALPDTDKLIPLARALGISVDELLGNDFESGMKEMQTRQAGDKRPGWFALHWYWLGLIPAAWGLFRLLWWLMLIINITGIGVGGAAPATGASEILIG